MNFDLMYALPDQHAAAACADVAEAVAYQPEHLSLYQLTIEPNTVFAKRPPANCPDDEAIAHIEEALYPALAESGYRRYEISAFARDKKSECHHNVNYWQYGDYIGIGAGAHSKITLDHQCYRLAQVKSPNDYMKRMGDDESRDYARQRQPVAADALPFEFMLNALRLTDGFRRSLFSERTGIAIHRIQSILEDAEGRGLITQTPQRITPTARGLRYLNEILLPFLNETQPSSDNAPAYRGLPRPFPDIPIAPV